MGTRLAVTGFNESRNVKIFEYFDTYPFKLEYSNNRGKGWRFVINKDFPELLRGGISPKDNVLEFMKIIVDTNSEDNNWVIGSYGNLIALRNPMDRTTTIYPKWYYDSRSNGRFNGLTIKYFK